MNQLTIRTINHVQITVARADVQAARDFYCGVMNMIEIEKPDSLKNNGGFWMMAGDMPVHVGVEENVDRRATKAHVAYEVEDLGAWRARLEECGVKPLESTPIPGHDRFEFRDPFGNRVELISPK